MIDKYLIEVKLRRIEDFLREIETQESPSDFDSFQKNLVFKRFVERNIELAVEQMIAVCRHLVSGLDLDEPETYAECFEIIGQSGIIATEAVGTFQSMARYRNLLIHAYDGVDDTITYGIYNKRLNDFRLFVSLIRGYLQKN